MPEKEVITPKMYRSVKRSDEIDELLAHMPSWTVRWGITLIFGVILLLLTLSYFVKYPDVVKGSITITTQSPTASLVARSNGNIELLVNDKAFIKEKQPIAIIKNAATYQDIQQLKATLNNFKASLDSNKNFTGFNENLQLGDLQGAYNRLILKAKEEKGLQMLHSNNQERKSLVNQQIEEYQQIAQHLKQQVNLFEKEYANQKKILETRYRPLHNSGSISTEQYENKLDELNQRLKALEATRVNLNENENRILTLQSQKIEYKFNQSDKQFASTNELLDAYTTLSTQISIWENAYILTAPIAGRLNYLSFIKANTYLTANQEVATIIPEENAQKSATSVAGLKGEYIGEMFIESLGSGKIEVGQRVNINLLNYPKKEMGMLQGIVKVIADVNSNMGSGQNAQSVYKIYVELPKGLTTTYNKKMAFRYGMQGGAEVITKDKNILSRIFETIIEVFDK